MPELNWIKSSYSDAGGNNCIEVAATDTEIALRESAAPEQIVSAEKTAFRALVASIKAGRVPL